MLRTCVPISCTHVRSDLPETLPYSRSPSESPLHFADRRAESVVVGVITLPQKCLLLAADSRVRLRESFLCGESTSPTGDVSRDSKGAQHPWHTTLVQSLVCYTFPEMYTFLKCKKPHTQHLDGADMGLDASSA